MWMKKILKKNKILVSEQPLLEESSSFQTVFIKNTALLKPSEYRALEKLKRTRNNIFSF